MATKNKAQHLGNREDYQDLAAYIEEYGTPEGWEAPVGATYKNWGELSDFWKGAGVDKDGDGQLSMAEIQPQMEATLNYWNAKPKRSKMSAISEEVRRALPYVAAVAPFAGAGSALGSLAKGTSSLGKFGSILTGGGKFAKNPLVNMAIKQAISKGVGGVGGLKTLGSAMQMGSVGHSAADMFNKGIYAPEKAPKIGEYQGPQINPQTGERAMPATMEDYWTGIGQAAESTNLGGNPITENNMWDWMGQNFPAGSSTGGGTTGGTTRPGGAGMPGGGAGGNMAAMALMGTLLKDAFKGDDKPAPAPATGGQYGAGLPTYGNLIGMATNADAIRDQQNRLKFGRRTA